MKSITNNTGVQLFGAVIIITVILVLLGPKFLGAQLNIKDETIEALINAVIVVIPIFVTWFVRNFVKSAEDAKTVALMADLAGTAIGYVEDLDRNDKLDDILKNLDIPKDVVENVPKGLKKLNAATKVLETELSKRGVKITEEEAQSLIRGEFQKVAGNLGVNRDVVERTQESIALLQNLQQAGLVNLPSDVTQLSSSVVDWAIHQANQNKDVPKIMREAALNKAQEALTLKPQQPPAQPPDKPQLVVPSTSPEDYLVELARQAVAYVRNLRSTQELNVPEIDIAVAWVLTEVTKQGINVTTNQIAQAVKQAFAGD